MKLYDKQSGIEVDETWGGHAPACKACREVDLASPRSFTGACSLGSRLLMEEMCKRNPLPIDQKPDRKVEMSAASLRSITRYVGDA